jgi:hypothetical protein
MHYLCGKRAAWLRAAEKRFSSFPCSMEFRWKMESLHSSAPFPELQLAHQYPSRLFTMFSNGSPFSNLAYCFRKKLIA